MSKQEVSKVQRPPRRRIMAEQVGIRLSKEQMAWVCAKAEAEGTSITGLIRSVIQKAMLKK